MDANDTLRALGPDALARILEGARPYPPKAASTSGAPGGDAANAPENAHDEVPPPRDLGDGPPLKVRMRTDLGNAERLIDRYGDRLRWCVDWGCWLVWTGTHWARDRGLAVERFAARTARGIYAEAELGKDVFEREEIAKWAKASEGRDKLGAMIALARSQPGIPVAADDLDAHAWLLNAKNGTIDLRTGRLRPHRREDLLTKLAGAPYTPDAGCPRWEAFLREILPGKGNGDEALISYFQRAIGYALVGEVSEHVLFFLHGGGANGKSTAIAALLELFGDHGAVAVPDLLLSKHAEGHPTELAKLQGVRLAVCQEIDQGRRFAEARLKQLTGGDRLTARFMRADFFDFKPSHTLFLAANHKPTVRGTDHAVWRRLRLIPFTVTIPPERRDRNLGDKLRAELPGILAWAVRGCLAWQRDGLGSPDAVEAATSSYRDEMDTFALFLAERCELDPAATTGATDLWNAYRSWAEQSGEHPVKRPTFAEMLAARGIGSSRRTSDPGKGRIEYHGIRLVGVNR